MPRDNDSPETIIALLTQKLDNLQKTMDDGFAVTHDKQNYTNGKVMKAAEDITNLQKADISLDNRFKYNKVIWYLFTAACSVIIALGSYILYNK